MKNKNYNRKIIILIVVILLIGVVFIIFNVFARNKLLRDVSWGQSIDSVVKQEHKINASANVSVTDNQIYISPVTVYGVGGAKLWYYFEDNKLNEILVRFEHCDDNEDFSAISNSVISEFGEPVTKEQTYMSWSLKNTFISLKYDAYNYNIDFTLKKQ